MSIIVAAAENGVIGHKGEMPWRQSADLKFFKETTTGRAIIMGRTTFESIGRALPNRTNIVLSGDKKYQAPGCVVATSLEEALKKVGSDDEEVFIIGGASVYKHVLEQNIADRIYLTRVHAKPHGDTFFEFNEKTWRAVSEKRYEADDANQYSLTFYAFEKV